MKLLQDYRHVSDRKRLLTTGSVVQSRVRPFPQLMKYADQACIREEILDLLAIDFGDQPQPWDQGASRDAYLFPEYPPLHDIESPRDPEEIFILFILSMTLIAVASYSVVLIRRSHSNIHDSQNFPEEER